MDWFQRLTGFRETGYDATRRQLEVNGRQLRSRVNGRTYGIGEIELVSLLAAAGNAQRGASNVVLLTRLGGGAFGNDDEWISAAMRRALQRAARTALDVRLVSYGPASREILQMADDFG